MNEWPFSHPWPLMELTTSQEGQSHLVFMDKRGSGEIVVRLVRLSDGHELDSRAYAGDVRRFGHLPRDAGLTLKVNRTGDPVPTITLAVPEINTAEQLAVECSWLQIREGRLAQAPDAAGSLGRIVLTRDSLARYGGDEHAVVWRQSLPPSAGRPALIATTDPKYMILRSDKLDTLLDLSTGQRVCGVPRAELNDRPAEGPTLLMNGATPHLVHQQLDGVRINSPIEALEPTSPANAAALKPSPELRHDPRQWRNPLASPLNSSDRTLTNLIASMTRVGLQSLFGFVIPLVGLSWLIQKRRFPWPNCRWRPWRRWLA